MFIWLTKLYTRKFLLAVSLCSIANSITNVISVSIIIAVVFGKITLSIVSCGFKRETFILGNRRTKKWVDSSSGNIELVRQ